MEGLQLHPGWVFARGQRIIRVFVTLTMSESGYNVGSKPRPLVTGVCVTIAGRCRRV